MELNPIEIANKETPQLAELTASIQAKAPSNPNAPKNTEGQALDAYLSGNEDLFSGVGITPKKQKILRTNFPIQINGLKKFNRQNSGWHTSGNRGSIQRKR